MRIYYDTEFTSLTKAAELISAGFVTELGAEFYIEFEGVSRPDCSDFVLDVVYPLLRAPGVLVKPPMLAVQYIADWLAAQSDEVVLISDSNYDSDLLSRLFRDAGGLADLVPGMKLKYEQLWFRDGYAAQAFKEADLEYFLRNPGMRHHALHDARALKIGALRGEGFY